MAWVFDPESGEYYDDEQYFTEQQHPGSQQAFLGNEMSPFVLPGDYNKYGMEPYEQADVNQQLTGIKSMMNLWGNPLFALFSDAMGGTSTLDYNQFLNPGAYGGGGGQAGNFQSVYATGGAPYQTSFANSIINSKGADPLLKDYMQRIANGEDSTTLKLELLNSTEGDQNKLDMYSQAIDKAFDEKSNYDVAAAQQAGVQSPLQQQFAKMGLPDPTIPYTADTLPDDVDLSGSNAFLREARSGVRDLRDTARQASQTGALDRLLAGRGGRSGLFGVAPPPEPDTAPVVKDPYSGATTQFVGGQGYEPTSAGWEIGNMPTPEEQRQGITPPSQIGNKPALLRLLSAGAFDDPTPDEGNRFLGQGRPAQAKGWDAFGDKRGWFGQAANNRAEEGRKAQRTADARTKNLDTMDRNIRAMAARDLTRAGRTPVRQAMQDRIAMMRAMGIGI